MTSADNAESGLSIHSERNHQPEAFRNSAAKEDWWCGWAVERVSEGEIATIHSVRACQTDDEKEPWMHSW